jgi:(2Fe-2S) ferredoxin
MTANLTRRLLSIDLLDEGEHTRLVSMERPALWFRRVTGSLTIVVAQSHLRKRAGRYDECCPVGPGVSRSGCLKECDLGGGLARWVGWHGGGSDL